MDLASDCRRILVDLSECSFLDSWVLKTLLQADVLARKRGGRLELVAVDNRQDAARRTLQITNVGELLRVHPTRATGVASLGPEPA